MRALFTTQPAIGAFRPLVPLARALTNAGHDVAFACAESFRPHVEACGFEMIPAGIDWTGSDLSGAFPGVPPLGPGRLAWVTHFFRVRTACATVPDLLAIAATWKPDVFVCDPTEFGAGLAGEILGVPHVVAGAIWFRSQIAFAESHGEARHAFGLPPDPEVRRPYQYLVLPT